MLTNESTAATDGDDIKIGAAKHRGRNLGIGLALAGAAALLGGYYVHQGRADAPRLAALADFRSAYAEKCEVAEFRGPTPPYVVTEYLDHDDLQNVVTQQRAAIAGGNCKEIDRALRAAGFPISSAKTQ